MSQSKLSMLRAYKNRPGAGKRLADGLGAYIITSRPPHLYPSQYILNWGVSRIPIWEDERINRGLTYINHPDNIRLAVNKLDCFRMLEGYDIPIPLFTADIDEARSWTENGVVFCRTLLNSNKGKGIVLAKEKEEVVPSPLYTLNFDKTHEFRIHVFGGEVIDRVEKRRRNSDKLEAMGITFNPFIRNIDGGSVFCRKDIFISPRLDEMCIEGVEALGLDFGAVDVLAEIEDGVLIDYCICEINTAPNLQGTTLEKYIKVFNNFINEGEEDVLIDW